MPTFTVDSETNGGSDNPLLRVDLIPGESVISEAGAMVMHSSTVSIEGRLRGGLFKGLSRAFFSDETFFQVVSKCIGQPGYICFAPSTPGAIAIEHLSEKETPKLYLSDGAFLASSSTVTLGTETQSLAKAIFSDAGFFVMHASGYGHVALNVFGGARRIELAAGELLTVDNGHLVAWTTKYNVTKAARGLISTAKSGEGIVFRMTGPGIVIVQTRNLSELASSLRYYIEKYAAGK